ncbi:MAG: hypothetical protein MZV70_67515 [Desulfobacterales bacterium]|nr:hypothetical protein [Desulfobacterales bacterium]
MDIDIPGCRRAAGFHANDPELGIAGKTQAALIGQEELHPGAGAGPHLIPRFQGIPQVQTTPRFVPPPP